MRRSLAFLGLLLPLVSAGCGKTGSNADTPMQQPPGASGSVATGGAANGGATAGGATARPSGGEATSCAVPTPSVAPASVLLASELNRTIGELLSGADLRAAPWLPEDADYLPLSASLNPPRVEALHALAHDVALKLSQDAAAIRGISGCDPSDAGEQECQAQFLTSFLSRAYRRPVTDEDRAEMDAVFAEGQKLGGDFASGVRAVVEVALQNPDFVYLVEQGTGAPAKDVISLSGYETAARLAYFLTGSAPDAELAAEAERGPLDVDTVEAHARRLLGSEANRQATRFFYRRLLGLGLFVSENAELGYSRDIAELAREETLRFVEDVTFDGAGTFAALFTEPATWVNEPLASFYGLTGVTGSDFRKVALDPQRRAGLLTQSAFLRAYSITQRTNPVQRGVAVLTRLLCYNIPPPPAGLPIDLVEPPAKATTRQRLEVITAEAACQGCHHDINPVGFAFEHYDAVGRWRDTEEGLSIDTSGELYLTDAQGPFRDAIELSARIAESDDAKACFARRWLEQANRRGLDASDKCALSEVTNAFADSSGNLVELMVAVAKTEGFRYRRIVP